MANINFDNPQQEAQEPIETEVQVDDTILVSDVIQNIPVDGNGMSLEELNDANKIRVTIANTDTPLVVLFGPPACGKTMTLVRLTRYLQSKGYAVQPITSFRPAYDKNYRDMCDNFDSMINSDDAAQSTAKINFMLVEVRNNQGRSLCQILEGPGEYYFNPATPNANFPNYVNAIISSANRKIWAIMVEPDSTNTRMSTEARKDYVTKIHKLKTRLSLRDKIMFIFNKIDETPYVISPGNIRYGLALQQTSFLYPNIFVPFRNVNPITKWWKPNNFDFVAFQTGDFSVAADGTKTFQMGHDVYPMKLWKFIQKRIRG